MSDKLPEVPEPPWRVLATYLYLGAMEIWPEEGEQGSMPQWWAWIPREASFLCEDPWKTLMRPERLTVIPHPKNDPEAIELIERAKKGT